MSECLKIVILIFSLNIFFGCTAKKIYEKEILRENQFVKQLGPRDAAILRYGYKGVEENIVIEPPIITPAETSPGSIIRQEVRYGLLSENKDDRFIVQEIVTILVNNEPLELLNQQSEKEQGVHLSIVQITLPKDLAPGQYKLITTFLVSEIKKIVSATFVVK
jgi:hypothetical protein